jgi:competence protein ComEC
MHLFISFLSGITLFYLFDYFPLSSVLIFAAFSLCALLKKKAFLLPVLIIGIIYALIRAAPHDLPQNIWNKELVVTGQFHPVRAAAQRQNSILLSFHAESVLDPNSGREIDELKNADITIFSDREVAYSHTYELFIKTARDRTRRNPGGFKKPGIYASLISFSKRKPSPPSLADTFNGYRNSLNTYALKKFRPDSAGLITAITTGERSYISHEIREAFNITGLAHMLSISGTHFGLFSIMLFGLFTFVIKRLPYRFLHKLTVYLSPAQLSALLCIPFMLFYLGISGGSLPALRSFVMISLFLAGLLLGRKGFWLHSLLFAAVLLVLWDPGVIMSLSFQLSFVAVLFIGFSLETPEQSAWRIQPKLSSSGGQEAQSEKDKDNEEIDSVMLKEEKENKAFRYIKKSIMITIAASVGTAPLVAYYFHYLSVISPLANLLVAPVIGFTVIPFALLSSFSFVTAGFYLFAPLVSLSADLSLWLVWLMANIPFAGMKIPAFPPALLILFYAGFLFYILMGKNRKFLILPFLPFLVYAVFYFSDSRGLTRIAGQEDSCVRHRQDRH